MKLLTFFWNLSDAIGVLFFTGLFLTYIFLVIRKRIKDRFHKEPKKPSDFKVNQIYKMAVAKRSHVTKPYYVIIVLTGPDFIETYIPGQHSLRITYPSDGWDYHIPRMTYVKTSDKNDILLHHQKLN